MLNNEHSKSDARKARSGAHPSSCQVFVLASCLSEKRLYTVTVGLRNTDSCLIGCSPVKLPEMSDGPA